MKRVFLAIICSVICFGVAEAKRAPKWIEESPSTEKAYIGIASVSKSVDNYRDAARLKAFNEIASQITISIETTSFLNTSDVDDVVKQQFTQNIHESLVSHVRGHELVESYESKTDYYVYYKLDRDIYKTYIEAKRKEVTQIGLDLLIKGKELEMVGDLVTATSIYVRGVEEVEPYLNLSLDGMYNGKYVNVGSELFTAYKSIFSGLAITSNVKQMAVESLQAVREPIAVCLSKNGSVLPNVSLSAKFISGAGDVTPSVKTDNTGTAVFYVTNVTSKADIQTIKISIDDSFMKSLPSLYKSMLNVNSLPTLNITLALTDAVRTAYFYVKSDEVPECQSMVRSIFANNYFEIVTRADADLYIMYSTSLRAGGEVEGQLYKMRDYYCSLSVKIYNNSTQSLISEYATPEIRVLVPASKSKAQATQMCAREMMKQFKNGLPKVLKNIKL